MSHGASPDLVFGPSGTLAAVAAAPVWGNWTVSQPGAGVKYGGVPQDASESPEGAVVVDGEAVVVVDREAVVVVAHGGGSVAGGGASFGMYTFGAHPKFDRTE